MLPATALVLALLLSELGVMEARALAAAHALRSIITVPLYPCAVVSDPNRDYGTADLEHEPRLGTTLDVCTAICVQTDRCEGFSLKTDGRCYLKDYTFNSSQLFWRTDNYTSYSVSVQACTKPANLFPLQDPYVPSSPPPPAASSPSSSSTAAFVGGVVGGLAVLLCCILVVIWLLLRSRRRRRKTPSPPDGPLKPLRPAAPTTSTWVGSDDSATANGGHGEYRFVQSSMLGANTSDSVETGDATYGNSMQPISRVAAADVGLPEIRGFGLYQQPLLDNALLDNTSEVERKAGHGGGSTRSDVSEALEHIIQNEDGYIDRKYRLDEHLSSVVGGQAIVAMVTSVYSSQQYAMKLFADRDVFLRERAVYAEYARVLGGRESFYHDDRDHGRDLLPNGKPRPSYIVLLRGMSMQRWISSRIAVNGAKIPNPYEIMWMVSEVCNQLQILHNLDYVHRDIKPDNILWLQASNGWRIIDFGSTLTIGTVAPVECTIRFAPPEAVSAFVAKRPLAAHPSMDVYSVGVMAYELITGNRLFPPGSTLHDMKEILLNRRPFPHEQNPLLLRVAGKMRKTVEKMLSRNPEDRPTIHQVVAKFQELANDTGCTLTSVTTAIA